MNLSDRNRCWNTFRCIKSVRMFHMRIFHIVYWSGLLSLSLICCCGFVLFRKYNQIKRGQSLIELIRHIRPVYYGQYNVLTFSFLLSIMHTAADYDSNGKTTTANPRVQWPDHFTLVYTYP